MVILKTPSGYPKKYFLTEVLSKKDFKMRNLIIKIIGFSLYSLSFLFIGSIIGYNYSQSLKPIATITDKVVRKPHTVEVGDVWEYSLGDVKNPFRKNRDGIKETIIGVRDGYVQYIQYKHDTLSEPISYFLIGNRLIKPHS
jgi:hypothetical protein